ncbi:MAG: hypothetical protein ACSHWU_07425 [Marinicella sp.]
MNQKDKYILFIYRACIVILAVAVINFWTQDVRYMKFKLEISALAAFLAYGAMVHNMPGKNNLIEMVIQFGCVAILIFMLLLKLV